MVIGHNLRASCVALEGKYSLVNAIVTSPPLGGAGDGRVEHAIRLGRFYVMAASPWPRRAFNDDAAKPFHLRAGGRRFW